MTQAQPGRPDSSAERGPVHRLPSCVHVAEAPDGALTIATGDPNDPSWRILPEYTERIRRALADLRQPSEISPADPLRLPEPISIWSAGRGRLTVGPPGKAKISLSAGRAKGLREAIIAEIARRAAEPRPRYYPATRFDS